MNRHEQLRENYEDALFELLMEGVIEHEGKRIREEMEQLDNDPNFSVPPELDRRCLRTINKAERKKRVLRTSKKLYRVFSKFSVAAIIALALFTSAYAAIPAVRVSTLNLLIEVSDIATELTFGNITDASEINGSPDSLTESVTYISGYMLPNSILNNFTILEQGYNQFTSWITFNSYDNTSLISIEVQTGVDTTINLNTEDASKFREIEFENFKAIIAQQNTGEINAGIADTGNLKFIVITFEGIEFDTAVSIITDFLTVN